MRHTTPGVFIFESNTLADEKEDKFEGRALRDILRLLNRRVDYRYFRTKKELGALLKEFRRSGLRYLHLASHGNKDEFVFTLDQVSTDDFARLAARFLGKRRLFISACEVANRSLARPLFAACPVYSMAGPAERISYSDAAVAWAAFYNLVFRGGVRGLKHNEIEAALRKVCRVFGLKFNAYFRDKKDPHYRRVVIGA
jgi:hypothetical protein